MDLADLLTVDRIMLNLRARDKRGLIAELSRLAAAHAPAIGAEAIEQALSARERLGSTGLGSGFALPHARLEGLPQYIMLLARLSRPVDFEAIDGKPVDTVALLLIPGEAADHVSALAAISRRFRDADLRARLREAASPADALRILAGG